MSGQPSSLRKYTKLKGNIMEKGNQAMRGALLEHLIKFMGQERAKDLGPKVTSVEYYLGAEEEDEKPDMKDGGMVSDKGARLAKLKALAGSC